MEQNDSKPTEVVNVITYRQFLKNHKKAIIGVIFLIIIITGLFILAFSRQIFGDAVGDMILGPGIDNGFVLVANFFVDKRKPFILTTTTIVILVIIYFIIASIVNATLKKTPRSKTIASIIKSFSKFFLILIGIILILVHWGVSAEGICIGTGVTGAVVGLGCKDIVYDIIAGFFILADNYFEVGDVIQVGDFQGEVIEIGLRSTRIKSGIRVKIIANSQINSIIYYSKGTTRCKVELNISYREDLHYVESVIAKNLPKIMQEFSDLKLDIKYNGVSGINDLGLLLQFTTVVNFGEQWKTEKVLTRALYLMLKDNNIHLAFNRHITIDQNYNEIKASDDDVKNSNELARKMVKKRIKTKARTKVVTKHSLNKYKKTNL